MMTFEEIGKRLGMDRRNVQQAYQNGMRKIQASPARFDLLISFYEERNRMRAQDPTYQCSLLPSWEGRALAGVFETKIGGDSCHI
jgi:hypothetical protein